MANSTPSLKCRACDNPVPVTIRGGPRGGPVRSGYYCSDACKPRCSIAGCDRPKRKRGWCANHYATWRSHGDPEAEIAYTWGARSACLTCGSDDLDAWEIPSRQFCTQVCKVTWRKYDGNVPESFECTTCGATVPYFDPATRKRRRSDSKYCGKHTRTSYVRVTVDELAAEDGAVCRLCGEPVDMTARGHDRRAPSIDHIIPKALGGSDGRENLQLAHYGCNASKRHSYIG